MRIPPLDVYEEGGAVVVKAELPGMKKEEIDIHVSGNALTISGKKEKEENIERKDYRRLERAVGRFARTVTLPYEVEPEAAERRIVESSRTSAAHAPSRTNSPARLDSARRWPASPRASSAVGSSSSARTNRCPKPTRGFERSSARLPIFRRAR